MRLMRLMRQAVAHAAFVLVVLLDTQRALDASPAVLAFPAACAALWFSQSFFVERRDQIHMALHLVSIVGMHVYFTVLYQSRHDVAT